MVAAIVTPMRELCESDTARVRIPNGGRRLTRGLRRGAASGVAPPSEAGYPFTVRGAWDRDADEGGELTSLAHWGRWLSRGARGIAARMTSARSLSAFSASFEF